METNASTALHSTRIPGERSSPAIGPVNRTLAAGSRHQPHGREDLAQLQQFIVVLVD
jgi:hypothetical protein